jgi:hypothetical protein
MQDAAYIQFGFTTLRRHCCGISSIRRPVFWQLTDEMLFCAGVLYLWLRIFMCCSTPASGEKLPFAVKLNSRKIRSALLCFLYPRSWLVTRMGRDSPVPNYRYDGTIFFETWDIRKRDSSLETIFRDTTQCSPVRVRGTYLLPSSRCKNKKSKSRRQLGEFWVTCYYVTAMPGIGAFNAL